MVAHKEACQVFIEQEIQEGLAQGKTPYSIGKDLSAWVEKLFKTVFRQLRLRKRPSGSEKKSRQMSGTQRQFVIPQKSKKNKSYRGLSHRPKWLAPNHQPLTLILERNRPGRDPKYPQPPSDAIHSATVAISQLSRIEYGDPKREQAFNKVVDWINSQLEVAIRPKKRR